ncbi:MAG: efflux RND transporter permease subunit [Candidatus Dojkabacteria bacterium]
MRKLVADFSAVFANNFRLSALLIVAILGLGALSYTTLLQREGFPAIEFPIGTVQVQYFAGDAEAVKEEVTAPIETAIADIETIQQVDSTTTGNFTNIVIQFESGANSEEEMREVREQIDALGLPNAASVNVRAIDVGSIDGTHDLLFSLAKEDATNEELQAKAEKVAEELRELAEVENAEAIDLISTQVNPQTGEKFQAQQSFRRYGENIDGQVEFIPAVTVGVSKVSSAGTVEISDAVRGKVDQLKENGELEGYTVSYGGDFAEGLNDQISSLESNALTGLLAVVVILFLFVNWRASLMGAIFMPLVLAATFGGLFLIGYTLNVISLFALILVLGLFVDDAIIVVEAIDAAKKRGKKGVAALKEAVENISIADISGTITTLLVFFPIATISGVLGEFIVPIPVTVMLALVISLVLALSLGAFLSNLFLADKKQPKSFKDRKLLDVVLNTPSMLLDRIGDFITWGTKDYLRRIWLGALAIPVSLAIIFGGAYFFSKLDFAIFSSPKDADELVIQASFEEGTTVQEAEIKAREIESILLAEAESQIDQVDYLLGNESQIYMNIRLIPMGERDVTAAELVEDMNADLEQLEGVSANAIVSAAGPPESEYDYSMQIFTEDQAKAENLARDIQDYIQSYEFSEEDVTTEETIVNNLEVIARRDGRRYVSVQAKIDNANTGSVVALRDSIEQEYDADKLRQFELSEDALGFDLGQESQNLDSFNSAIFAMAVAIIVMYAVLVVQFNSFSQPLLILLAIPFSFPGVAPGLYLTDNPLSFFVLVGFIGLIGIVVNNTIMLLDYANQLREEGVGIRDAISEAIHVRFRPLVTTTATTLAGLMPLALSDPFWESLAYTIIFGLLSSTLMVVLFFPAYYTALEWLRHQRNVLFGKVRAKLG